MTRGCARGNVGATLLVGQTDTEKQKLCFRARARVLSSLSHMMGKVDQQIGLVGWSVGQRKFSISHAV